MNKIIITSLLALSIGNIPAQVGLDLIDLNDTSLLSKHDFFDHNKEWSSIDINGIINLISLEEKENKLIEKANKIIKAIDEINELMDQVNGFYMDFLEDLKKLEDDYQDKKMLELDLIKTTR